MQFSGEITVTYSNGVLKPDQPLDIAEGSRLRATIWPAAPDPVEAAKALEAIKQIRNSGAFRSGGRKFTRDRIVSRNARH